MDIRGLCLSSTCHFIYICTQSQQPLFRNRFASPALAILGLVLVSSCSPKLTSVLVEDPNGNVELTYQGSESTENLVKEVRFYPNGDTLSVTPMKKGAVNGNVLNYYPHNHLKELTTFVDGQQKGVFKRFDTEGVLVFEGQLVNGLKEGIWTTWYDDVQMQEQRNYLNDQPDGKWTYWFIDGTVRREEVYKLGKLVEEKDYN